MNNEKARPGEGVRNFADWMDTMIDRFGLGTVGMLAEAEDAEYEDVTDEDDFDDYEEIEDEPEEEDDDPDGIDEQERGMWDEYYRELQGNWNRRS